MVQAALASMLGFGQVASREKSVSSHVPYLRHVDEQTLRTKDGLFVTSVKLDGFCFQTADQSEINQRLSHPQYADPRDERQPLRRLFAHHPARGSTRNRGIHSRTPSRR